MKLAVKGVSISPKLLVFLSGCWSPASVDPPSSTLLLAKVPATLFVNLTRLFFLDFSTNFFVSFLEPFLPSREVRVVASRKGSFFDRKSLISACRNHDTPCIFSRILINTFRK